MAWYLVSLFSLVAGFIYYEAKLVFWLKQGEKWLNKRLPHNEQLARQDLETRLSQNLLMKGVEPEGSKKVTLLKYKFYTDLYEDLITLRRKMGTSQEQNLKTLREGLIQDAQFEKKVRRELNGGLTQFLLITLITWTFAGLSLTLINMQISPLIFGVMVGLELLGLIVFTGCFKALKRSIFSDYGVWFFRLYRFRSLVSSNQPVTVSLKESQILELFQTKKSKFLPFVRSLESAITRLQKSGAPIQDDLKFCLEELWFTQGQDFELFLKHLTALKLAIILLFYLGAYFVFLYSFISTFTAA